MGLSLLRDMRRFQSVMMFGVGPGAFTLLEFTCGTG